MDSADEVFRSVPKDALPDLPAVFVEIDGEPRFLIRDGEASPELIEELNKLTTHLVRHGLWIKHCEQSYQPPRMRRVS